MFGYQTEPLEKLLQKMKSDIQRHDQILKDIDKQIAALKLKKDRVLQKYRISNGQIEGVKEAIVISKGVPRNIAILREKIRALTLKAASQEITIRTKSELEIKIQEWEKELQKQCPHTFIVGYGGYHDQYGDGDEGYSGQRLCLVCGVSEYELGSFYGTHEYKILKATSNNVVREKYHTLHERLRLLHCSDFSKPLENILEKHLLDQNDLRVKDWCQKTGG